MIFDFKTLLTCGDPAGAAIGYGDNVYDLLEGQEPGVSVPELFQGEPLCVEFEVTVDFDDSLGSPVVQFGVALGNSDPLDANAHVLCLTGGSIDGAGIGFKSANLTPGAKFSLPLPPWHDLLEEDAAEWPNTKEVNTLADFRGYRYLGLVAFNPVFDAGANTFLQGAVQARITKDFQNKAVLSNLFPSQMKVK